MYVVFIYSMIGNQQYSNEYNQDLYSCKNNYLQFSQ